MITNNKMNLGLEKLIKEMRFKNKLYLIDIQEKLLEKHNIKVSMGLISETCNEKYKERRDRQRSTNFLLSITKQKNLLEKRKREFEMQICALLKEVTVIDRKIKYINVSEKDYRDRHNKFF